jgi:hypothetical protein
MKPDEAHQILAAVTAVLAAAVLTAAPAAARVAPEPGDARPGTPAQPPVTTSSSSCPHIAAGRQEPIAIASRAVQHSSTDPVDGYSGYPGGAGGNSNGELTAGQLGKPVGAGGTSAGSSSQFAQASARASSIALTSSTVPIGQCPHELSLAERRLSHADLILVRRDGA